MPESESYLVTVPGEWNLENHAVRNRKFPSVQDFIRELVRRDMEAWDKEELERKAAAAAANAKK
ncbi:MAG: hypothetical protein QW343_01990 [Candidatus Norongarragalinales archaeon]